jgi:sugar/nucleoside kinase (ribokinase family)
VVAVTLGAQGAVIVAAASGNTGNIGNTGNSARSGGAEDVVAWASAGPVTVVDTLGAGDAFIARLLVGLARGEDVHAIATAATAYASYACTSYGAFGHEAPLPSTKESS